jgi:hypothetical protein
MRISKLAYITVFLFALALIPLSSPPASIAQSCEETDIERSPLRPYPGDSCNQNVPQPNTVVCANRPKPVGEEIYTFTCAGPTPCTFVVPPTTFEATVKAGINEQVQTPFTSFAEFTRPDYQPSYRLDKYTYLADYLGGSGSVFYDTQPLLDTDQITPSPQQILDHSSSWQRLTPHWYQQRIKGEAFERVDSNTAIHDYVAVYVNPQNEPIPRSEIQNETLARLYSQRISEIQPAPIFPCSALSGDEFDSCRENYEEEYEEWAGSFDGANWKYVPPFTLEDAPGFAYLNLDGYTSRSKIFIPHLPRITRAVAELQRILSPSRLTPVDLPALSPGQNTDSEIALDDPVLYNGDWDEGENPGAEVLATIACDLEVSGYSPADYVNAAADPETVVSRWTEPGGQTVIVPPGQTQEYTVKSEFPSDRSRYLLVRQPYVKEIWRGLYRNTNAVYRILLPKPANVDTFWQPPAEAINWDYPAEGTSPFENTSGDAAVKIKAGNDLPGEIAKFYFKYLYRVNQATHDVIHSTNPFAITSPSHLGSTSPVTPSTGGTPGTLSCTMPITSCAPVNWNASIFDTYEAAYNSDNNASWSLIKEPWAQEMVDNSGMCPQFVATLWLEESGGGAVGAYGLGCIYNFNTGNPSAVDQHPTGLTPEELKQYQQTLFSEQLECLSSYANAIGDDFDTFMCQYSGETDTDPTQPFRQCSTFTLNPNFPVNMCSIGSEIGIATPN